MSEELIGRVMKVIADTQRIPLDTIKPDSTFEELKIDSLDGINILFGLENEFNINIPDDSARGLRTVRDMAEGVEKLVNSGAAAQS